MLIWLAFAFLTTVAVAAVVWPLVRSGGETLAAADADIAIYRDQLAEIDAEREQGLIGPGEADAARTELGRRMIERTERAEAVQAAVPGAARGATRSAIAALCGALPMSAIALYLVVGSPAMPDRPFIARAKLTPEQATVAELIAKVEARLAAHPEDAQGWDVVGPVYLMQRRYDDARRAFSRAIALAGETVKRLDGLIEASIAAGNGIVSDEARAALERMVTLSPERTDARFWLAVAKEQDGKLAEAADDFQRLIDNPDLAPEARQGVAERLATVRQRLGPVAGRPTAGASGQTPADMAAVAGMPDADRARFVERMVESLAQRLKADGADLAGWLKLVRAYKVLGRDADASAALSEARTRFSSDAGSLGELDALARTLGIGS